jgi:hypothetical protein
VALLGLIAFLLAAIDAVAALAGLPFTSVRCRRERPWHRPADGMPGDIITLVERFVRSDGLARIAAWAANAD